MKSLWNSISVIGHQKLVNASDLRQLKLLNRIAAAGALNLLSFLPITAYFKLPEVATYVSAGMLLCSLTLLLNYKGYFKAARLYFVSVTTLFIASILIFMSGRHGGSQIVFILVGTLHLVLFKNEKAAIPVFLVVVAVFAFSSWWVEHHQVYLDFKELGLQRFSFYLNILSTMILVFSVVLYFKNAAVEFETTITEQNKKITQKNKDILDSINYAKRLQEAILPPDTFFKTHLPESFTLYQPKDIVAGDFYWLHPVPENNGVLIAAADCTGHGVPGAMVSVVCSNAMNRAVKEFGISEPAKILNKVRELVLETFEKSESEVNDGMDISLAAIYTNADTGKTSVLWAGANNPLWIVQNKEIKEIKADKQPVGRHSVQTSFTSHSISLNKGDSIYLFTDGFADQFGGPRGKKFKYKQLQEIILANSALSLQDQKQELEKAFKAWKGNQEQVDDVCVIGIRV